MVDGKLPEAERTVVVEHVQDCERCQSDLQDSAFLAELLHEALVLPDPPTNFSETVMRNVTKK